MFGLKCTLESCPRHPPVQFCSSPNPLSSFLSVLHRHDQYKGNCFRDMIGTFCVCLGYTTRTLLFAYI